MVSEKKNYVIFNLKSFQHQRERKNQQFFIAHYIKINATIMDGVW